MKKTLQTFLIVHLFGALLFGIPSLHAQETGETNGNQATAENVRPAEPPASLASPRATMRTFLEAFPNRDWDAAVSTLDLSRFTDGVRLLEGRDLATRLKDVIDRIAFVSLEDIPAEGATSPWVWQTIDGLDIALEKTDRGWLFSSETIRLLPDLLDAVEDRTVVEGVAEAPRTAGLWLRERVPESLRRGTFLFAYWQWLGLALLAVLGWLFGMLARVVFRPLVNRWFSLVHSSDGEATEDSALEASDDREEVRRLVDQEMKPIGLLTIAIVWWFGLSLLGLPPRSLEILLIAVRFVAIAAVVLAAYRLVDLLSHRFAQRAAATQTGADDLLVPILDRFAKILIAAFGIVFIADNSGLNITSLLTGLGIGGIALALAAKDTVENLFGSITVLLDRPFESGDRIVTGSIDGTVEEVGLRSTRIRTAENSLVTLPNANLINAAVDNFGARSFRRWKTTIGISYDTPPETIEAFCEGLRELVRQNPHTRKDVYYIYLNSFGASSLDILFQIYFVTDAYAIELEERHRISIDILRLAGRLGIEIAYPTQTLHLHQETESGSGSGAASRSSVPAGASDFSYQVGVEKQQARAREVVQELIDSAPPRPET
jgi:MscS family membrane protein